MIASVFRPLAYFVTVVALFLVLESGAGNFAKAAQNPTQSPEQWREDLRYLAEILPLAHLNVFHEISPDAFAQAVAELNAEIPGLADHVISIKMMKLVAMIGDAHTSLDPTTGRKPVRQYPILFTNREDGIFVTGIQDVRWAAGRMPPNYAYARALGARLVRVGDMDIDQVVQLVSNLGSTDPGNPYSLTNRIPFFLRVPEILNAVGVMPDMERGRYVVEDANGLQLEIKLTPFEVNDAGRVRYLTWPWIGRWTTPLVFSRPNTVNYWFEYVEDRRALYIRYRLCAEMTSLSFADFWRQVSDRMEQSDVDRLVIDLRDNPGGNSGIFQPYFEMIRRTTRFNQRGKLFVLINNGTASSGMIHANSFQLFTQAILIGKPTGGRPNSYGELGSFYLPNSLLRVSYSTKFFRLRPNDDPPAVMPEIYVDYPWAAFRVGRDPALETALSY